VTNRYIRRVKYVTISKSRSLYIILFMNMENPWGFVRSNHIQMDFYPNVYVWRRAFADDLVIFFLRRRRRSCTTNKPTGRIRLRAILNFDKTLSTGGHVCAASRVGGSARRWIPKSDIWHFRYRIHHNII
jgi:hypothetical protein